MCMCNCILFITSDHSLCKSNIPVHMVTKQAQVDDAGDPVCYEEEDDGEDGVEAVLGHHLALE